VSVHPLISDFYRLAFVDLRWQHAGEYRRGRSISIIARRALAIAASAALALPGASALAQSQTPTLFVTEFRLPAPDADPDAEEHVAERGEPVLLATIRPELAVELLEAPSAEVQRTIGASAENPLAAGTRLYGSSNRSSLYCHMLTNRVVASGGTCLRDFDGDGSFEQGVELEAPGLSTDVVVLDHAGRWYGATFADREQLRPAVAYRVLPAAEVPTWPARVSWSANVSRIDPEDYPVTLSLGISARDEGQSTDVIGECRVQVLYAGEPVTMKFYGNTLTVLGFTEEGSMRYVVEAAPQPTIVPFIYQFETRSPYVGLALARNARRYLPCTPDDELDVAEEPAAGAEG
jgi:hypothetical protein